MNASYKVWHCSYNWFGKFQTDLNYECVVVAEIDKALGMALMHYPKTQPEDWSAVEIPTDKEGVHEISQDSH